jgi:hydroxymethylpyrimidine/phosphomethylpyrimidine kinase
MGFGGLAIRTAHTEQGARGGRVVATNADEFKSQLDRLPHTEFIKVGLLPNGGVARALVAWLRSLDPATRRTVVLDPVRVSSTGLQLADDDAFSVVRDRLLPLVSVVTPNLDEAAALTQQAPARTADAARAQAIQIQSTMAPGAAAVVTGGHLAGSPHDFLATDSGLRCLRGERVLGDKRGTGCRHSSALLAGLAQGLELESALQRAQSFVRSYILAVGSK